MNKKLILFVLFAFFGSCKNQNNPSNHYSTKNLPVTDSQRFAFEMYTSASSQECVNGGWVLIPTTKANDLTSKIETSKKLTICLTEEESEDTVSQENNLVDRVDTQYSNLTNQSDDEIFRSEIAKIYEADCKQERLSLEQFPHKLKNTAKQNCYEFAESIASLYRGGALDLSNELYEANEPTNLSLFLPFGAYTRSLIVNCQFISGRSTLRKFESLEKMKLIDCSATTDIWEFLPASLMSLEISDSALEIVGNLSHLVNLKMLSLPRNRIRTFPAIMDLKNLRQIDLKGNPIVNYSPIIEATMNNPTLQISSDMASKKRKITFQ